MHEYFIVKDLDVCNGGSVLVNFDFLTNMSFLEDIIPIIDNLEGLQYLYSSHCNFQAIPKFFTTKEACFVEN